MVRHRPALTAPQRRARGSPRHHRARAAAHRHGRPRPRRAGHHQQGAHPVTAVHPRLTVREAQILELLRGGASVDRASEIGAYRRSWTRADVTRVAARLRPTTAAVAPVQRPKQAGPRPTAPRTAAKKPPPPRSPGITPWTPPPHDGESTDVYLTPRESDVLTCLCHGLSNRQIGAALGLSEDTVKSHMRRLLSRLGARDRAHTIGLVLTGAVVPHVRTTTGSGA
ncbi:MAG: helix-turn-helix transcriptional regulator [Streptomycetaceae bacterium]|nr:helix-turn-helix transcriptional regulator [Streptomycetaceae bacterium]